MNEKKFIEILKKELVPSMGCTEPAAIAYAVAKTKEILQCEPDEVIVELSGNMIKNIASVGIPNSNEKGLPIIVALGLTADNSSKMLEIFSDITPEKLVQAKNKMNTYNFKKVISKEPNKLYIKVTMSKNKNTSATVEIKDFHTAITKIEKDDKVIYVGQCDEIVSNNSNADPNEKDFMTVESIYNFAKNVPLEQIKFMEEVINLNEKAGEEGLKNSYGLQVGKTRKKHVDDGIIGDTVETFMMALTAAAVDVRMSGATMPIMSNSGSGNQGIATTLPVIALAKKLNSSHEELLRALTLASLLTIHTKNYLGRLSALCGCVLASTGATAGISYLLGGNLKEIEGSIKNLLGNITGMFCDGAKPGCALKISTGVSAALQSALLAKDGFVIGGDEGIVDESVEQVIKNVGQIGKDGMVGTDKMILDIMMKK